MYREGGGPPRELRSWAQPGSPWQPHPQPQGVVWVVHPWVPGPSSHRSCAALAQDGRAPTSTPGLRAAGARQHFEVFGLTLWLQQR